MDTTARHPARGASGSAPPSPSWPDPGDDESDVVAGCQVAPGITQLGEAQGSGLHGKSHLVRRDDGQVIQLSELLHLVLRHLDPAMTADEMAEEISLDFGRRLTADGLRHLVETRLMPLGLVTRDGDEPSEAPRANPLLSLSFRGTLIPARIVAPLARVLAWSYLSPIDVNPGAAGILQALESIAPQPTRTSTSAELRP